LGEVFRDWIPVGGADYDPKLFSFAIIWWSSWLARNKMRMENKFLKHPSDVLFSISSKMQRWGILLRPGDRKRFEEARKVMEDWVKDFLEKLRQKDAMLDATSL
jgi:hypothetical protein